MVWMNLGLKCLLCLCYVRYCGLDELGLELSALPMLRMVKNNSLHHAQATASMAKYWGTDLQVQVADDCVQLHGGWGYMWEYPVCRALADGRVQKIYGGTNEIMKELIAREVAK